MKINKYLVVVTLFSTIFLGVSVTNCSENTATEEQAQKVCNLKLDFLVKHDVRNKLPQMRSIVQELIKLSKEDSAMQAKNQGKRFELERELGILTVLYLQDLTPKEQKELASLAASCQKTIHRLPAPLNEKWRQSEIYRVFLAS